MITFKKFGKEIKILTSDWKKIRKRFNPHNAIVRGKRCIIEEKCPLCKKYLANNCVGCPLDVFYSNSFSGCTIFFSRLFTNGIEFQIEESHYIHWQKESDLVARTQLYNFLDMMDKIEASQ
jgi:hypothetical protein